MKCEHCGAVDERGPHTPENCRDVIKSQLAAERARAEKAEDAEHIRWQERLHKTVSDFVDDGFDPSGNESGDPLDFTDDLIGHALAVLEEHAIDAKADLAAKTAEAERYREALEKVDVLSQASLPLYDSDKLERIRSLVTRTLDAAGREGGT